MLIPSTPSGAPIRLAPVPVAPSAPAVLSGADGFSPSRKAAEGLLTFMGRRIPTTVPEISPEKANQLQQILQPGDVLLSCDCAYPGWARMEYWTVRSNYTHAAYYAGEGKVYEAVGGGVLETPIDEFFQGRMKVAIVRPPYHSPEDVKAATDYCKAQLGKPYDSVFNTGDNNEFYCSELVSKALKSTPHPIESPTRKLLGRDAVAPDAFLSIPGAVAVHNDGSDYWKNKLGHWPLASAAVGGAVAGGMLAGAGGAGIGFGVGLLGSILVGNKIQAGHFLPSLADKGKPAEPTA